MSAGKNWPRIVAEAIVRLIPEPEHAKVQGARLVEDLGFDSLDIVEVSIDLEGHLGIDISEADQELWITVGDIVRFCEVTEAGKAAAV